MKRKKICFRNGIFCIFLPKKPFYHSVVRYIVLDEAAIARGSPNPSERPPLQAETEGNDQAAMP